MVYGGFCANYLLIFKLNMYLYVLSLCKVYFGLSLRNVLHFSEVSTLPQAKQGLVTFSI